MNTLLSFQSPFEPTHRPSISLDTLNDAYLIRYAMLAALTLQVYDYITNLDEEIRFIWRRDTPCAPRLLFFLNRYTPFMTAFSALYFLEFNLDQSYCHPAHYAVSFLALAEFVIAELTLCLRTCAVCANRAITTVVLFLVVISTVGAAINTFYYIHGSVLWDIGVAHRGCLFWYRLRIEWICVLALIFCESVALCLLVIKTVSYCRHAKSNIMVQICKDSIFYFVCILALSVANLLLQLFATSPLCDVLLIPQSILHQILCAHFILRLRRLSEQASLIVDPPAFNILHGSSIELDVMV